MEPHETYRHEDDSLVGQFLGCDDPADWYDNGFGTQRKKDYDEFEFAWVIPLLAIIAAGVYWWLGVRG